MNAHRMGRTARALWFSALLLFALASISHGTGQLLTRPLYEGNVQSKATVPLKSYELRKGRIALATEVVQGPAEPEGAIAAYKRVAPTITIGLFADVTYEATILSVEQLQDGTTIMSGRLRDHDIGTVVLTIGPEGFLMTVQDMDRTVLYRVSGNSQQGYGTVTEIDMKAIPPMIR